MSEDTPIWSRKSPEETAQMYADWADSYDQDVTDWGYATPARIAEAAAAFVDDLGAPILDFGCGTGLSGQALAEAGFTAIDGTDVSPEMIARAEATGVYEKTWLGEVGSLSIDPTHYATIIATGVISLGAAQPETLDLVLSKLAPGGLLIFSYNDATLRDARYLDALAKAQASGSATLLWAEYGDHLPEKNLNSTIYVLEKK